MNILGLVFPSRLLACLLLHMKYIQLAYMLISLIIFFFVLRDMKYD